MEIKGILRSAVNGNYSPVILLAIIAGALFSAMIPPMQSPDEIDHIKRAYLLSKGQFILDTPAGYSSGGDVDSGLLQYMNLYSSLPHHPEAKVTREISSSAQNIKWSGTREFSPAPGTGYYFPLAYAPQAFGLMIGELLDLSVETSYRLARLMVLVSSIFLISIAFTIFPANPLAVALLIIPMSIFQFASASLDAFTTSLAIVAISLFLKMKDWKAGDAAWFVYALGICIFLVVSCRVHLIALLVIPYLVYFSTRDKKHLYFAAIISIATFAWLFVAIKFTHDYRVSGAVPASDAIKYYLANPAAFIHTMANTLGYGQLLILYVKSFIGSLGALDTWFSNNYYYSMFGILVLLGICSVSPGKMDPHRKVLLIIAGTSVFLIFFAILITANPIPVEIMRGVQGRYFLVPVLLASYSLTGTIGASRGIRRKLIFALLAAQAVATIWCMPQLLINRYFI